jgi:hypothetical protein
MNEQKTGIKSMSKLFLFEPWEVPKIPKIEIENIGELFEDSEEDELTLAALNHQSTMQQFQYDEIQKNFNLWTLHTNKSITGQQFEKIAQIPGIEVLIPVSSYQLRVGIAKLFKVAQVKKSLEDYLLSIE